MVEQKPKARTQKYVLASLMVVFLASATLWVKTVAYGQSSDDPAVAAEVAQLNAQIEEKRRHIQELQSQSDQYQDSLNQATSTVNDIAGQLTVIQDQIAQTNFQIQAKETEIDKIQLEMQAVQLSIDDKNQQLTSQRASLADTVKRLDQTSRTPLLNILLTHKNFGQFFDAAQAYASISDSLQQTVTTVKRLKDDLQAKQNQLGQSKDDLEQAKLQLEISKQSNQDQASLQGSLLADAENSQAQYKNLVADAVQAESQANATISSLENQVEERLNGGGDSQFTSTGWLWPVRGTITTYFHDPTYPFRCAFWRNSSCLEHSGLDIAVPQGTPIRATADGIVSAISNQGFYYDANGNKTRSALNFVAIVHGDGLSSRYLHLSAVYVHPDQFISQGEVIGLSGGLPGTAGSGGITTGAHLHFEIRAGGIPDDPLRYLP